MSTEHERRYPANRTDGATRAGREQRKRLYLAALPGMPGDLDFLGQVAWDRALRDRLGVLPTDFDGPEMLERERLVQGLRQEVEAGTYSVGGEEIAGTMVIEIELCSSEEEVGAPIEEMRKAVLESAQFEERCREAWTAWDEELRLSEVARIERWSRRLIGVAGIGLFVYITARILWDMFS